MAAIEHTIGELRGELATLTWVLHLADRQWQTLTIADSEAHMEESYNGIITIEPGKCGGKPCIRGMRITVFDVLSYLAAGMTQEEIIEDFPYLTAEDIRACLIYAAS